MRIYNMLNFPKTSTWTSEEKNKFEQLLIQNHGRCPKYNPTDFPNKSESEVLKHYAEFVEDLHAIEAGQLPVPSYADDNNNKEQKMAVAAKKKKRDPKCKWSMEEHRLFLEGLLKKGRGDWRGISREYVKSRTSAQVASHAQKYFKRQSQKEPIKRKSIHDFTLKNLESQGTDVKTSVSESEQQHLQLVPIQSHHHTEHAQGQELQLLTAEDIHQILSELLDIDFVPWQEHQRQLEVDHMISDLNLAINGHWQEPQQPHMVFKCHNTNCVQPQELQHDCLTSIPYNHLSQEGQHMLQQNSSVDNRLLLPQETHLMQQNPTSSTQVQGLQEGEVTYQNHNKDDRPNLLMYNMLPEQGTEVEINQGQGLQDNGDFPVLKHIGTTSVDRYSFFL